MREQNLELKRFLRTRLYRHYRVHRMTAKAARTITALFSAFLDDPRLLPSEVQQQAAMKEERLGQLRAALDSMDEIDREVLALRHFEELSNREASQYVRPYPPDWRAASVRAGFR